MATTTKTAAAMPLKTVKAASLAHSKKVSKPALACMAGMILKDEALHKQTMAGIAKALGVSIGYIQTALSLPANVRSDVAGGKDADLFRQIHAMLQVKAIVAEPVKSVTEVKADIDEVFKALKAVA
jgi:hypothetical protein